MITCVDTFKMWGWDVNFSKILHQHMKRFQRKNHHRREVRISRFGSVNTWKSHEAKNIRKAKISGRSMGLRGPPANLTCPGGSIYGQFVEPTTPLTWRNGHSKKKSSNYILQRLVLSRRGPHSLSHPYREEGRQGEGQIRDGALANESGSAVRPCQYKTVSKMYYFTVEPTRQ